MKLIDKIKDLFMEEEEEIEDIEIEEESNKKKPKENIKNELPKVMRENIKKEEPIELKIKSENFFEEQEEKPSSSKKFSFPMDIDNELPSRNNKNRYEEINKENITKKNEKVEELSITKKIENIEPRKNINVLNIEKEASKKVSVLYLNKNEEKYKPKFKASPVISPVYGVLDKNYTKEEVKEKTEDSVILKRPSKKVDFETVRKKAFGNLADEIKDNLLCENCELYKEVKKISALKEGDLLYDMTVDEPNNNEVTIEKAYDNYEEFGVAYEPKRKVITEEEKDNNSFNDIIKDNNKQEEDNLLKIISKVEEKKEEITVIANKEENKNEVIEEEPQNDNVPSREEKKKDVKVDDDFFELIDSMYKERTDD